MKKYIQLILLVILFPFLSKAQDLSATPEIFVQSSVKYEIIGELEGVSMILFEQNGYYKVRAFDKKMNQKWERALDFEKKSSEVIGFVTHRKSFNIFYKFKDKGQVHLRVRKFNNDLKMLDSTLVYQYSRRTFSPEPTMKYSKNKSKTVFFNNDGDMHLEAVLFDNKAFKTIRYLRFNPPNFSYSENFLDILVDNQGGIHLINERNNKRSAKEDNQLEFLSFLPEQENFRIHNLSFQNHLWYDLETAYDNRNQRILVGGLCSDRHLLTAHGTFFMSVNPMNKEDAIVTITPFTPDFLTLLYGKKISKNTGVVDVTVQEVIPRSDGGILMMAERNRKQIRASNNATMTAYDRTGTTVQTDYYFNEIMMFSYNPDGAVHWEEILHKKQYSQDDGGEYSSYFLFFNKANLRILYNDTIKRGDAVYEYVVNSQGDYNRNSLFNTTRQKLMLKMSSAIQVSGNELLVPSERRSQLRLVRLTF